MGYCKATALPTSEPVTLDMVKTFMKLSIAYTMEDMLILGLIQAAREEGELISGLALAQRPWRMVLDSAPYYTDTVQSQLAYPPSYYSLPRYSTTLWNYSQMIKLPYPPAVSVQQMRYIDTNGNAQVLHQDTDFIFDRQNEPARIFPIPGSYWAANLYVANALEIDFTAGYDPDPSAVDTHDVTSTPPNQQPESTIVTGIPQRIVLGILNLVTFWYNNRGSVGEVPQKWAQPFVNSRIDDWQPTRG